MPAPDRDKLRASLSSLLSGDVTPDVPPSASEDPGEPKTPPAASEAPTRSHTRSKPLAEPQVAADAPSAPSRALHPSAADADAQESPHTRTSTGYVREGGERVYRVSIMLTRDERRRLREQADDAGVSITDLVRRALTL